MGAVALVLLLGRGEALAQASGEAQPGATPAAGGGAVFPRGDPSGKVPLSYEDARVAQALAKRGFRVATAPEGKNIAFIRTIRRDVFEKGELLFDWIVWFNHLHALTRESVVLRELRLEEGGRYSDRYARETERNLRRLGTFSLVRVVAVEVPGGDGVGVVVFTRDLWSLRLETDFRVTNNTLQVLAQLVERNLFGRNQQAALRVERRWDSFSLGQFFIDYRAFGGRLSVSESADLIFNGGSGALEGGVGQVTVERPFYNLDQRWAYRVDAGVVRRINRDGVSGRVSLVNLEAPDMPCTLSQPFCARSVYRSQTIEGSASATYRRGRGYRQSFSAGLSASQQRVESVPETRLEPGFEAAFEREVLPLARAQVGPFLGYQLFVPDYVHFEGLGTFGRIEAVLRGPQLSAQIQLPLAALGSSNDALVASGQIGWVVAGDDALASVTLTARTRLERARAQDQSFSVLLRGATPRWMLGRLVWSGGMTARRRDTAQSFVSLGSLTGLRGYPDGAITGRGVGSLLSNLEYRTLPIDIESIHLGLVLFYDAGGVFTQLRDVALSHGVGLGFRLLFPQLNRLPFRFDFGVPLDGGGFSIELSLGGRQQVALTPAEDSAAASDLRSL